MFSEVDGSVAAGSKLAELVAQGDSARVIWFMNALNDTKPSAQRAAPVAATVVEQDPKSGEKWFVAKDASGKDVLRMSAANLQKLRNLASHAKPEFRTVNAGDSLVAIRNGEATPVYTAPESSKSAAAKQGPLERDVAYLVAQHGMSKEQALAHLSAAKTMSREQFILQGMRDSMDPARSKAELADELGALYDSIQRKRTAPAASNSPAPSTVHADPQLLELLSIPSTP